MGSKNLSMTESESVTAKEIPSYLNNKTSMTESEPVKGRDNPSNWNTKTSMTESESVKGNENPSNWGKNLSITESKSVTIDSKNVSNASKPSLNVLTKMSMTEVNPVNSDAKGDKTDANAYAETKKIHEALCESEKRRSKDEPVILPPKPPTQTYYDYLIDYGIIPYEKFERRHYLHWTLKEWNLALLSNDELLKVIAVLNLCSKIKVLDFKRAKYCYDKIYTLHKGLHSIFLPDDYPYGQFIRILFDKVKRAMEALQGKKEIAFSLKEEFSMQLMVVKMDLERNLLANNQA